MWQLRVMVKVRRRGVRRYFSKPSKGHKTYGSLKQWRRIMLSPDTDNIGTNVEMPPIADSFAGDTGPSTLVTEINPAEDVFNPSVDGFLGFDLPFVGHESDTDRPPVRVLSLFDGISVGYYVLTKKLGLEIEEYYSSEICKEAIRVQQQNFGEFITPLGSVCDLSESKLDELGQINLLIGGSPCEDLSLVNPKRKGLFDRTGTGHLFFEYVRIMKYLSAKANLSNNKFFWLFENTNKLPRQVLQHMNDISTFGCKPSAHNASVFVPMERNRYFWGNIPQLHDTSEKKCKVPHLQEFLRPYRSALVPALPTVTTSSCSQRSGHSLPPVLEDGEYSDLWPNELEVLFALPEHYTDFRLSATQKQRLLGKSWSVHVIANILQPLTVQFKGAHQ